MPRFGDLAREERVERARVRMKRALDDAIKELKQGRTEIGTLQTFGANRSVEIDEYREALSGVIEALQELKSGI